jgi:hypothetical protein
VIEITQLNESGWVPLPEQTPGSRLWSGERTLSGKEQAVLIPSGGSLNNVLVLNDLWGLIGCNRGYCNPDQLVRREGQIARKAAAGIGRLASGVRGKVRKRSWTWQICGLWRA